MKKKQKDLESSAGYSLAEDSIPDYGTANEWQLCPKCNGEGSWNQIVDFVLEYIDCDLCNGKKIISKVTGEPPK